MPVADVKPEASNWHNRIVSRGAESPDQLVANPRNWRIHPLVQQEAVAKLLERVGWVREVIVNQRTGNVVDGHLRVMLDGGWGDEEIAQQLGMEADELVRLKHITGFAKLFENVEYRRAWETKRQLRIRQEHQQRNAE